MRGGQPKAPARHAPSQDRARRAGRSERGVVGGIEVLPFGLLIFVVGSLIIANAWAVVDAKLTVESAAREATRSYVESPGQVTGDRSAQLAAREVLTGAGRDPDRLRLQRSGGPFERCAEVEYEASYRVAAVTVPFIGGFGSGTTVTGRHRERIEPFRAGLGPEDVCHG